jgi:hypothetical protein
MEHPTPNVESAHPALTPALSPEYRGEGVQFTPVSQSGAALPDGHCTVCVTPSRCRTSGGGPSNWGNGVLPT